MSINTYNNCFNSELEMCKMYLIFLHILQRNIEFLLYRYCIVKVKDVLCQLGPVL